MKYSCATCLFILLFTTGIKAQTDEYKTFTGGGILGINLCQVDGDRYFGYTKPGVCAGAFVAIHFTERIGAQAELLFSQKGSHGDAVFESPFSGTAVAQCHIGLSYVEVPAVLQYKYKRLVAEAGASYSVLVRTNEWILGPQYRYIDEEGNRFNSTDINYIFGLRYQAWKRWHANVRFQYSVLPIRPYERIPVGYAWDTKGQFNNLFSVRFVYAL